MRISNRPPGPDASDTYQPEPLQLQIPEDPTYMELRDKVLSLTEQDRPPGVAPLALGTALLAIPGCISRLVARWLPPCQAHPDVALSNEHKGLILPAVALEEQADLSQQLPRSNNHVSGAINESLGRHP